MKIKETDVTIIIWILHCQVMNFLEKWQGKENRKWRLMIKNELKWIERFLKKKKTKKNEIIQFGIKRKRQDGSSINNHFPLRLFTTDSLFLCPPLSSFLPATQLLHFLLFLFFWLSKNQKQRTCRIKKEEKKRKISLSPQLTVKKRSFLSLHFVILNAQRNKKKKKRKPETKKKK